MKRLGKILVLAAVAMLAMGVWANGVLAAGYSSGDKQKALTVRINPLAGFFDNKYARAEDPESQATLGYGKISTLHVWVFSEEEQIKDWTLSKSQPKVEFTTGMNLTKVEVHVKLVGVEDEIVQTIKLTKEQNIINIYAARTPTDKPPAIYRVLTRMGSIN